MTTHFRFLATNKLINTVLWLTHAGPLSTLAVFVVFSLNWWHLWSANINLLLLIISVVLVDLNVQQDISIRLESKATSPWQPTGWTKNPLSAASFYTNIHTVTIYPTAGHTHSTPSYKLQFSVSMQQHTVIIGEWCPILAINRKGRRHMGMPDLIGKNPSCSGFSCWKQKPLLVVL